MKIINKLKAFFFHQEEAVEIDLVTAEIKEGKAFLHPRGEEDITYLFNSEDIEVILSKSRSLGPGDIMKIKSNGDSEKDKAQNSSGNGKGANNLKSRTRNTTRISEGEFDRFKKKQFVVSLYQEEYDTIMSGIKAYGYKRADFVMACVNSASKGTMERAHKKIVKNHNKIKKMKAKEIRREKGARNMV